MVKMLRFIILVLVLLAMASDELNCQGDVDLDESKWEPLKPLLEKEEGEITFKLVIPAVAEGKLENSLLKKFDVVEARIHHSWDRPSFTIKGLEKSAKLLAGGETKGCIDFYDTWISAMKSPYTDNVWLSIHGYLLFPKSINSTTTKKVILNYEGEDIIWDMEKINKMIEILK